MYLDKSELYDIYVQAGADADEWKKNYPEYERLMDNGLLPELDPNLPEVNDGSFSASLFKAPKRIIPKKLKGRVRALTNNEPWRTEVANIVWEKQIYPNAKTEGSPRRKWKDAIRKSIGLGSVPIFTFFGTRGDYTGADFSVLHPYDVRLEPGKKSDEDSDVIFMDIYYTKLQLKRIIEQAETEKKTAKEEGRENFNTWDIKALKDIVENGDKEERESDKTPAGLDEKTVTKDGYRFYAAFQRGVDAPFYICYNKTKKAVREWTNPDPTGDVPIHFLYCYQDFINPYGIGLGKLAGGTQNILDYFRQADILATQLGIRPPISVRGDTSKTDMDSLVYAQDAIWEEGEATISRQSLGDSIYSQLPNRIGMYKISLDQMLPSGDTSIGAASGDQDYSKTSAGVQARRADISVDDEDFKENFNECFDAVAQSMINIHFANMEGSDDVELTDEEAQMLQKAGLEMPVDEATGLPVKTLEVTWENVRNNFDFEIDPDADKTKDEEKQLEGLLRAYEIVQTDPTAVQEMQMAGKKYSKGEHLADIISMVSDNDKIVTDISPEDQQMQETEMMGGEIQQLLETGQPTQQPGLEQEDAQIQANIQGVMQQYGVSEDIAAQALDAEAQGMPKEQIIQGLQELTNGRR